MEKEDMGRGYRVEVLSLFLLNIEKSKVVDSTP